MVPDNDLVLSITRSQNLTDHPRNSRAFHELGIDRGKKLVKKRIDFSV